MRALGLGLAVVVVGLPALGAAQSPASPSAGAAHLSSAALAEHAAVARSKVEAAAERLKRVSPPAIPSSALSAATPLRAEQVEALRRARTSEARK